MSGWPSLAENTSNGGWGEPQTGGKAAFASKPTPPVTSARLRLHKVSDVQRELRRLYIAARNGELSTSEASKLAYLLNMLANLMVDSDLEDRLEQLEAKRAK